MLIFRVHPLSLSPHRPDDHQHDSVRVADSSPDDDNEDEDFINAHVGVAVSLHGNNNPHLAIEDVAFTNNDDDEVATTTQQKSRATNFSENEILIRARAWIKVSTDPATGTDQKSAAFWQQISIVYGQFVATTNNKYSKTDGYTILPEERSTKSLKSQWHNRLLPIASRFAGIIATNPPKTGEQFDDDDLTSYYARLRNEVWPLRAGNLPKKLTST